MLAFLFASSIQSPVEAIDGLARSRDEEGMARYAVPELVRQQRFRFLSRNGVYETGRFGWRALRLRDASGGKTYVVFSTTLTSEDIGEQVFELQGSKLTRFVAEQDKLGVQIVHHDFEVRFDLPAKKAFLRDKVQFRQLAKAGKSFLIRMSPQYRVTRVSEDGGKAVPFSQAGGVVFLASPGADRSFQYTFDYSGIVDLPNYAGSVGPTEATLTNDYWYPMIARWPATYAVSVSHPADWVTIAQGEPGVSAASGSTATTRFKMDLPVTYFSLTAGPFAFQEHRIGGRGFKVWSPRMNPAQMRAQSEVNADVVAYYEKSFGTYPFSSWGSLESPHYGGGALEAYSYATYGVGWLPDLDAHEPAHTWWGGMINNTYLKSLWNESFAVFSDGLYHREGPIGNSAEKRLAFVSDASPSDDYREATCVDGGAHVGGPASSLGYGKGAKVLQMLEQELGTETLVRCMREWIATHPKGVPGEWEDFEKVVAKVSKKDLKWFFDQWLRRKGWADFELERAAFQDGQVNAVISWKGPKYHVLCDVMLQFADGSRKFSKERIGPTPDSEASFLSILTPKKPVLISIDPWRKLLRRYAANEAPAQLDRFVGRVRYFVDPARRDWLENVRGQSGRALEQLPEALDGVFVIGHPDTLPAMRQLCDKAGFKVSGNKLTYQGTTIDLEQGAALAVVDLGGGKRCAIGLGKTVLTPRMGRSRTCLVDRLGRFLRGRTDPKTSGFLTANL